MAYYAFINENNIVVEVIPGRHEYEIVDGISDWESHYEQFRPGLKCIRTSYNNNIRGKFAGIGDTYDGVKDVFVAPVPLQPYPSWWYRKESNTWESPVPYPIDDKLYTWNEETLSWDEIQK